MKKIKNNMIDCKEFKDKILSGEKLHMMINRSSLDIGKKITFCADKIPFASAIITKIMKVAVFSSGDFMLSIEDSEFYWNNFGSDIGWKEAWLSNEIMLTFARNEGWENYEQMRQSLERLDLSVRECHIIFWTLYHQVPKDK